MKDSWVARLPGSCMDWCGFGNFFGVVFGIKNTSDYDVEVKKIYTENGLGWDTLQSANPISVWRTSTSLGGEPLAVVKADTASTSLPAQVTVMKHAAVTTSSLVSHVGQLLGIKRHSTQAADSNAYAMFCGRHGGAAPWTMLNGTFRTGGFVQPQVLREGQGLALIADSPIARPRVQYVFATFRDQSSGATHQVVVKNVPAGDYDVMLSIFNGTGSGVILEVLRIESFDTGYTAVNAQDGTEGSNGSAVTGQSPFSYRMAYVPDIMQGDAITPVALDTANAALPAGLSFVQGGYAVPPVGVDGNWMQELFNEPGAGAGNGTYCFQVQKPGVLRGFHSHVMEGWQLAQTGFPHHFIGGYQRELFRRPGVDGSGFVIRKGQCLAMLGWYRNGTPAQGQQGFVTTETSIDEQLSTLSSFNFVVEFAVSVGSGTPVTGVPTAAATFIT